MCCGNSPFHSSSLPDARAPTNLPVTMRIRAAGRPSVCAISRSSPPPFSPPSKQSLALPSPHHVHVIHLRPTSPSHLQRSPQLHPVYANSHHHAKTPPPPPVELLFPCLFCLTLVHAAIHLSEHHPLTHLQSHLVNCGAKFPLISTPVLWAMEMMRKLRGQ